MPLRHSNPVASSAPVAVAVPVTLVEIAPTRNEVANTTKVLSNNAKYLLQPVAGAGHSISPKNNIDITITSQH